MYRHLNRKPTKELTAQQVKKLTEPGKYFAGSGLYLRVRPSGSRSWVQRILIQGKRRELGLGPPLRVSLSEARAAALKNREIARRGGDPTQNTSEDAAPSTPEGDAKLMEWWPLFNKGDWDGVENWWRHHHHKQGANEPLRALLITLREFVRTETIEHGTSRQTQHVHPSQLDAKPGAPRDPQYWAAKILLLGELEAAVEGNPPSAHETWQQVCVEVKTSLKELSNAGEVTEGHPDLSRRRQIADALQAMESIELVRRAMSEEMEAGEDKQWIQEGSAEIAHLAFSVGFNVRAAEAKEIEKHALRGKKVAKAAEDGWRASRENTRQRSLIIIGKMRQLKQPGCTLSSAARLVTLPPPPNPF